MRSNPASSPRRDRSTELGVRAAGRGPRASPGLPGPRCARRTSFAQVPDRHPGRCPQAPPRSPLSLERNSSATQCLPETPPVFRVGRSPFFEPHLDVGAVAQLAKPFLKGLVTLSIENDLARLDALALRGHVRGAPLEHLDEMPSEGGLDGLAYIHLLQLDKGPLEFRHGIARIDPSEISSPGSRPVVRIEPGELREVHPVYDAF